jgi:hypothetical protein
MIGGPYFEVHDWWTPIIVIIFVTWPFVARVAHGLHGGVLNIVVPLYLFHPGLSVLDHVCWSSFVFGLSLLTELVGYRIIVVKN